MARIKIEVEIDEGHLNRLIEIVSYLEERQKTYVSLDMAVRKAIIDWQEPEDETACSNFIKARDGKCYNCGFDEAAHPAAQPASDDGAE